MQTNFSNYNFEVGVTTLIDSISEGKGLVFVGAGASFEAGFPSWSSFLYSCLEKAERDHGGQKPWELTRKLMDQGDYLTAADLLQKGIGSQLEKYIYQDFSGKKDSTSIHLGVARIQFSLAITTNYDGLLENAYRTKTGVLTWKDPAAIFAAIKNDRFFVIKTHGDVGNGATLVLTKTQYREIINLNNDFNESVKFLLLMKTFLFVGYSLRDHDLLNLMDKAKLSYPQDFGPHYAILFDSDVDDNFKRFLYDSYSITVIECNTPLNGDKTQSITEILNAIGGKVAISNELKLSTMSHNDPLFSRRSACNKILESSLELTGSTRGDIFLIDSDNLQVLNIASSKPQICSLKFFRTDSIQGQLFLKAPRPDDCVYLPNVNSPANDLDIYGLSGAEYETVDSRVNSLLAVPIFAEGRRIGVFSIESEMYNAYTRDHLLAAQRIACRIGNIFIESRRRLSVGSSLASFYRDMQKFDELMNKSRLLKETYEMKYILWEANYDKGVLIARNADSSEHVEQMFESDSLATRCFRTRNREVINDVENELKKDKPRVTKSGCKSFGIKAGFVAAMPIQVKGLVSAVLIIWSEKYNDVARIAPGKSATRDFAIAVERAHRVAHLIANDPSGGTLASGYLDRLDIPLSNFYKSGIDEVSQISKTEVEFTNVKRGIFEALVHKDIGFRRVRLWRRNRSEFVCIASFVRPGNTFPNTDFWGHYVGQTCPINDDYCQYTEKRSTYDSYSRRQHKDMFKSPDRNCKNLHKHPDGPWLVAPLLGRTKMLGFVSADSHYPDPANPEAIIFDNDLESEVAAFQRFALDVASHLFLSIVVLEGKIISE